MDVHDNEYLNFTRILKYLTIARVKMHEIFRDRWQTYKSFQSPNENNQWVDGEICGKELLNLLMPKVDRHFRDTVKNGHVELWDITLTNQAIQGLSKAIENYNFLTDKREEESATKLKDKRNSVFHGRYHLSNDQYEKHRDELKKIMINFGFSVSDMKEFEIKLMELGQPIINEISNENAEFIRLKKVAKAFSNGNNFEGAIKVYNEMLNITGLPQENQSEIFANRSDAYYWLKTDDSFLMAKIDAQSAIELNPYWRAFFCLGRVQMELNEWEPAKEALFIARKQNPGSKEVRDTITILDYNMNSNQIPVQSSLIQLEINKTEDEKLSVCSFEPNILTAKEKETEIKNVVEIESPFLIFNKNDGTKNAFNRNKKTLNILLLGEVGVGKSTFINSVANYLTYDSIDEALTKPIYLIPSEFIFYDGNKEVVIKHGPTGNNEIFSNKGESSTQEPKTYQFENQQYIINFIDTPGISDVRGLDQDEKNTKKILEELENFNELHAICLFFRSNESRLTMSFKYCLSELLLQLNRNASDNFIFFFTHTRPTFYQPGDTISAVRIFLEEIKNRHHMEISLTKLNTFCMDNECFKIICAYVNGIKMSQNKLDPYKKSWKKSADEIHIFLVIAARRQPYKMEDTISFNKARTIILYLAKPLADVTELIEMNIKVLNDRKNELHNTSINLMELQKKLKTFLIDIDTRALNLPKLVCASSKCIKVQTILNTNQYQIIYKQICHDPCHLDAQDVEKVPNPSIKYCSSIINEKNCEKCGCHWSRHMHILFDQVKTAVEIEDQNIMDLIKQNQGAAFIKQKMIEVCERMINELKSEQREIIRTRTRGAYTEEVPIIQILLRFGNFLQTNSVLPYNDAFEKDIEQAVDDERKCSKVSGDRTKLVNLKKLLTEYQQEKKMIKEAHKNRNGDDENKLIKPNEIYALKAKLFGFKHNGKTLKNLLKVTEEGITKARATKYILEVRKPQHQ